MPQLCKICAHPDREAIDAALIENERAMRDIGSQYGVTKDSLSRHWRNHIPEPDGDEEADEDPDEARQSGENSPQKKKEPIPYERAREIIRELREQMRGRE